MLLLKNLAQAGYKIAVADGEIKLTWTGTDPPDRATVEPLLKELREHKQEAIDHIMSKKIIDFATEARRARAEIRKHGLARIRSGTLGEVVYFAADRTAAAQAPPGAVVYTEEELKHFMAGNPSREDLQWLHQAKKMFNGTFVSKGVIEGSKPWREVVNSEAAAATDAAKEEEQQNKMF